MTPYVLEVSLHWIGVGLYLSAAVAISTSVFFERPRALRLGLWLATAGLAPHGAAVVLRWVRSGHGPYLLRSEVLSSNAWVAMAALLVLLSRRAGWSALAVPVIPLVILADALALFSNPEARDLPPTLRSVWLVYHIVFAKISAAAFLLSMGCAVLLLLARRQRPPAWIRRAPPIATLDALVVRSAGLGLVFWTVTIAAGAIWGSQAWGRYWGWDPMETWSLVSWIAYGALLHARLFFRLGPRSTAWLSLATFVLFLSAALIFPLFGRSLHAAYMS